MSNLIQKQWCEVPRSELNIILPHTLEGKGQFLIVGRDRKGFAAIKAKSKPNPRQQKEVIDGLKSPENDNTKVFVSFPKGEKPKVLAQYPTLDHRQVLARKGPNKKPQWLIDAEAAAQE